MGAGAAGGSRSGGGLLRGAGPAHPGDPLLRLPRRSAHRPGRAAPDQPGRYPAGRPAGSRGRSGGPGLQSLDPGHQLRRPRDAARRAVAAGAGGPADPVGDAGLALAGGAAAGAAHRRAGGERRLARGGGEPPFLVLSAAPAAPGPSGRAAGLGPDSHRRLRAGQAGGRRAGTLAPGRQGSAVAPRLLRSDRTAAQSGRGGGLPGRRLARRLCAGGGPAAGLAPVRRALGQALARPGPLRRVQQLRAGRPQAAGLALPRLRHPLLQPGQALRPLHSGAVGGRRTGTGRSRKHHRHRLLPPGPLAGRTGGPGAGALRGPGRYRHHHQPGVPGPDAQLRPLPRPQAGPASPAGLLPFSGLLPRHEALRSAQARDGGRGLALRHRSTPGVSKAPGSKLERPEVRAAGRPGAEPAGEDREAGRGGPDGGGEGSLPAGSKPGGHPGQARARAGERDSARGVRRNQETPGVDTGGRSQPGSAGALRDRGGSAAPGNLRAGPRQRSGQGGAGRAGLPLGPFASPARSLARRRQTGRPRGGGWPWPAGSPVPAIRSRLGS